MLPILRSKNAEQIMTITNFAGLNSSYSQKVNELSEGVNLSSELYPALSCAKLPEADKLLENKALGGGYFNSLYTLEYSGDESGKIYLCTDNSKTEISSFSSIEEISKERRMAFMKKEILVIPDNIIYHTNTNTVEKGCVSESISSESAQKKFEEQSGTNDKMPMPYNTWYSAYLTGNSIVAMNASYRVSSSSYKYYHFALSDEFKVGDVITLKLSVKPIDASQDDNYRNYRKKMSEGISVKIKDLVKTSHSIPNGTIAEYTEVIFEDNAIDMGGYNEVFVLNATIEKGIPNFVDICTFENRMWGVTADKIHASKLGDSSEWNDFSIDSYGTLPSSCFATEVESDGEFTAIIPYNGNILAFKENCIHKIYGNEPEEYTVTRHNLPGVCKGGKDTLANVGGVLYYMGTKGVYAYSGSQPRLISDNVIKSGSMAAHAGGDERFYYIETVYDGNRNIFVYDTWHRIWHKIAYGEAIIKFVLTPEGMCAVTEKAVIKLNRVVADNWSFELCFGTKEFSSKHVCGVAARYTLKAGGEMKIYLHNRNSKKLVAVAADGRENGTVSMRIPVSCDRDFRLEFKGGGYFEIGSLEVRYRETGIYD